MIPMKASLATAFAIISCSFVTVLTAGIGSCDPTDLQLSGGLEMPATVGEQVDVGDAIIFDCANLTSLDGDIEQTIPHSNITCLPTGQFEHTRIICKSAIGTTPIPDIAFWMFKDTFNYTIALNYSATDLSGNAVTTNNQTECISSPSTPSSMATDATVTASLEATSTAHETSVITPASTITTAITTTSDPSTTLAATSEATSMATPTPPKSTTEAAETSATIPASTIITSETSSTPQIRLGTCLTTAVESLQQNASNTCDVSTLELADGLKLPNWNGSKVKPSEVLIIQCPESGVAVDTVNNSSTIRPVIAVRCMPSGDFCPTYLSCQSSTTTSSDLTTEVDMVTTTVGTTPEATTPTATTVDYTTELTGTTSEPSYKGITMYTSTLTTPEDIKSVTTDAPTVQTTMKATAESTTLIESSTSAVITTSSLTTQTSEATNGTSHNTTSATFITGKLTVESTTTTESGANDVTSTTLPTTAKSTSSTAMIEVDTTPLSTQVHSTMVEGTTSRTTTASERTRSKTVEATIDKTTEMATSESFVTTPSSYEDTSINMEATTTTQLLPHQATGETITDLGTTTREQLSKGTTVVAMIQLTTSRPKETTADTASRVVTTKSNPLASESTTDQEVMETAGQKTTTADERTRRKTVEATIAKSTETATSESSVTSPSSYEDTTINTEATTTTQLLSHHATGETITDVGTTTQQGTTVVAMIQLTTSRPKATTVDTASRVVTTKSNPWASESTTDEEVMETAGHKTTTAVTSKQVGQTSTTGAGIALPTTDEDVAQPTTGENDALATSVKATTTGAENGTATTIATQLFDAINTTKKTANYITSVSDNALATSVEAPTRDAENGTGTTIATQLSAATNATEKTTNLTTTVSETKLPTTTYPADVIPSTSAKQTIMDIITTTDAKTNKATTTQMASLAAPSTSTTSKAVNEETTHSPSTVQSTAAQPSILKATSEAHSLKTSESTKGQSTVRPNHITSEMIGLSTLKPELVSITEEISTKANTAKAMATKLATTREDAPTTTLQSGSSDLATKSSALELAATTDRADFSSTAIPLKGTSQNQGETITTIEATTPEDAARLMITNLIVDNTSRATSTGQSVKPTHMEANKTTALTSEEAVTPSTKENMKTETKESTRAVNELTKNKVVATTVTTHEDVSTETKESTTVVNGWSSLEWISVQMQPTTKTIFPEITKGQEQTKAKSVKTNTMATSVDRSTMTTSVDRSTMATSGETSSVNIFTETGEPRNTSVVTNTARWETSDMTDAGTLVKATITRTASKGTLSHSVSTTEQKTTDNKIQKPITTETKLRFQNATATPEDTATTTLSQTKTTVTTPGFDNIDITQESTTTRATLTIKEVERTNKMSQEKHGTSSMVVTTTWQEIWQHTNVHKNTKSTETSFTPPTTKTPKRSMNMFTQLPAQSLKKENTLITTTPTVNKATTTTRHVDTNLGATSSISSTLKLQETTSTIHPSTTKFQSTATGIKITVPRTISQLTQMPQASQNIGKPRGCRKGPQKEKNRVTWSFSSLGDILRLRNPKHFSPVSPQKCLEMCYEYMETDTFRLNGSYAVTHDSCLCIPPDDTVLDETVDLAKCDYTCEGDAELKCGGSLTEDPLLHPRGIDPDYISVFYMDYKHGNRVYVGTARQPGSIGNWSPKQTTPMDDDEGCHWCYDMTVACTSETDNATGKLLYYCQCQFPWHGRGCDRFLDPCNETEIGLTNPCRNGAKCIPWFRTNYYCECTSGFGGVNCTQDYRGLLSSPRAVMTTGVTSTISVCGIIAAGLAFIAMLMASDNGAFKDPHTTYTTLVIVAELVCKVLQLVIRHPALLKLPNDMCRIWSAFYNSVYVAQGVWIILLVQNRMKTLWGVEMNKWGKWRELGIFAGFLAFWVSFVAMCFGLWGHLATTHTCLLNIGPDLEHPIPTFVTMATATFFIAALNSVLFVAAKSDILQRKLMRLKRAHLWAMEAYDGEGCFAFKKIKHSYWVVFAFIYIAPIAYWSNNSMAYYQNPQFILITAVSNILMGMACIGGATITDEDTYSRWTRFWMKISPCRCISYKRDPVTGMKREEVKAGIPVQQCKARPHYWRHRIRAKQWAVRKEKLRFTKIIHYMKKNRQSSTLYFEQCRLQKMKWQVRMRADEELQRTRSKYQRPCRPDGYYLGPINIREPWGAPLDRVDAREEASARVKGVQTPLEARREWENRDEAKGEEWELMWALQKRTPLQVWQRWGEKVEEKKQEKKRKREERKERKIRERQLAGDPPENDDICHIL